MDLNGSLYIKPGTGHNELLLKKTLLLKEELDIIFGWGTFCPGCSGLIISAETGHLENFSNYLFFSPSLMMLK